MDMPPGATIDKHITQIRKANATTWIAPGSKTAPVEDPSWIREGTIRPGMILNSLTVESCLYINEEENTSFSAAEVTVDSL